MAATDCASTAHLAEDLAAQSGLVFTVGASLAPWTSLKVGGPAQWSVRVQSAEELSRAVAAAAAAGLPWRVVGGGSNVLVSDRGVPGVVVLNAARGQCPPAVIGDALRVRVESGTPLAGLARRLARAGWTGLEWACGIPGTVGGAVVGNAGAHGGEIKDVLLAATVWQGGSVRTVPVADLAFGYRTSALVRAAPPAAVLTAEFRLRRDAAERCAARVASYERWRRAHQPRERSAGSMFRNPPGDAAGRLIDAAGLKGTRVGGAEISRRHANFFINRGSATAADVAALIELARRVVRDRFGVSLTLEIVPLGCWDERFRGEMGAG